MVHVIYDKEKIITVQEPIDTGIRRTQPGRMAMIENIETAKNQLSDRGYDITKIEEFENL